MTIPLFLIRTVAHPDRSTSVSGQTTERGGISFLAKRVPRVEWIQTSPTWAISPSSDGNTAKRLCPPPTPTGTWRCHKHLQHEPQSGRTHQGPPCQVPTLTRAYCSTSLSSPVSAAQDGQGAEAIITCGWAHGRSKAGKKQPSPWPWTPSWARDATRPGERNTDRGWPILAPLQDRLTKSVPNRS
jgi:hypothetical protein